MMTQRTFGKQDYLALRAALDFAPRAWVSLAVVAFDAGLLALAAILLRAGGAAAFLASQVLLAIVFFNSFSLLHECGHGTASRWPWLNTIIGHLASVFAFIPYFPWKYIHQKHHLWTANLEQDPVLKSLRTFRDRGVPRLAALSWRSWIPVGALLQHVVYLTYPLAMRREGELPAAKAWRSAVSVVFMPAGWLALWWLFPDLVRPVNLALAIFIHLVVEELVNLPHHVDMPTVGGKLPPWDQHIGTRSCYYPRGLSELICLNFNFHIEHHLFPDLPWFRLRHARALVKPALGDAYEECVGVGWNLANRRRDLDAIVARYRAEKLAAAT